MPFQKPYPSLRDFVKSPEEMKRMVQDASLTVEGEVAKQKGITGAALRASWKIARTLAPDYVERVMGIFFEPSLDIMTPYFHEALEADRPVPEHFDQERDRLATALLELMDHYSSLDDDGPMKRAYQRMRSRLHDRMMTSMQPLGELVQRHLPPEWTPGKS